MHEILGEVLSRDGQQAQRAQRRASGVSLGKVFKIGKHRAES